MCVCTSATRWRRVRRGSMKVKSKPLPPLRKLEGMEEKEDEEEEEEIEMKGLVGSAEDDKDEYYFEDPSNIGASFSKADILNLIPCVCYRYSCSDRS